MLTFDFFTPSNTQEYLRTPSFQKLVLVNTMDSLKTNVWATYETLDKLIIPIYPWSLKCDEVLSDDEVDMMPPL